MCLSEQLLRYMAALSQVTLDDPKGQIVVRKTIVLKCQSNEESNSITNLGKSTNSMRKH